MRLTRWLQGEKVRALASTPVSRACFGIRCGEIKLQSCRRIENGLRMGLACFCFFIPAEWQSESPGPSHFLTRYEKAVLIPRSLRVFVCDGHSLRAWKQMLKSSSFRNRPLR